MIQQIQIRKVRNRWIGGCDVEVPEVIGCDCNLKYRRIFTCCLPLLVQQHKWMINLSFWMGGSVIFPDNSFWCFDLLLELVILLSLSDMHVPYVRVRFGVYWLFLSKKCHMFLSIDRNLLKNYKQIEWKQRCGWTDLNARYFFFPYLKCISMPKVWFAGTDDEDISLSTAWTVQPQMLLQM